ncbi:MAG: HAD family hydrolase [Bacteroidaceae bacterium]|nr:HAD family hydrolase [Bacteroidaceae bacterium]
MSMTKAIIFDLDGTLTYTLQDLCNSTNHALRQMGWPERSLAEVRQMVGNGVRTLIRRAVPQGVSEADFEFCFAHFRQHYLLHCQDNTSLYPGVDEMLQAVHRRGLRTAIVSNKLQAGVDELYETYFRGVIDVAIGQREGVPLKPAPDMVELALSQLGANKDETVYVGDSEVDVQTARNAGLRCISCLWGFRDREQLEEVGATQFICHPSQLLPLCF